MARARSRWQQFWDAGGWWRALLLAAVYFALYELLGLAYGPLAVGIDDVDSAAAVLVFYVLPVLTGCVLLVVFLASVRWFGAVFGRQPIRGSGWMWIAIGVVLVFNVLRFASIDYASVSFDVVATWLLAGLFVGFAEEVLTRGIVVHLLRRAGHRELTVALISSAVFAGLHAGNLLSGQPLLTTLVQLGYTFCFGICMYLAMRVTGTIVAPILLHASTDPSIFLHTTHASDSPLSTFASLGNIVVIVAGLAMLAFIRGRVNQTEIR